VAVDYVSMWVEAMPCRNDDSMHSKKMFEEIIFPSFGVPRIVISDRGSHLIDKRFEQYLSKHGIHHDIATPYHPQTSGQVETTNKQIKNILQKTVKRWGQLGRTGFMMHSEHTGQHTKQPSGCHPINLSIEKLVTYQ